MTKMTRITLSLASVCLIGFVSGNASAAPAKTAKTYAQTTNSNAARSAGRSVETVPARDAASDSIIPRINLEVGSNVSRRTDSQPSVFDHEAKFNFETAATLDLGRGPFVLETGLGFRQLGEKFSIADDQSTSNTFNYLTLPILAKYFVGGENGKGLYIRAGLTPAYALSQDIETTGNRTTTTVSSTSFRGTTHWDVLASAGLGGIFPVSKQVSILVNLDAVYGLVNLDQPDGNDARFGGDFSRHNEAIAVTTGVAFNL